MLPMLIEDTRQQLGKHRNIREYFKARGTKIIRDKMLVGDYTLPLDRSICIDIKRDVIEIAGNICSNEHRRFRDECLRAKQTGTKLYILVEENVTDDGVLISRPEDLAYWEAPKFRWGERRGQPKTLVKGAALGKAMRTMENKYGVTFLFCDKTDAGRVIEEILEGGNYEA